jgi:hypothetical protein
MRIHKDRKSGLWVLSSVDGVHYQGRRSPWDHPEIIRQARQQRLRQTANRSLA